jgi:GntR family transcriptional regulator/MocR family aminotransferase
MNYSIDKNAREPAYIQLYRFLVKDITAGVYPFGTKLPSKRVMAEETGVSVITVEHAMTLLNEEGYVESRQRSGAVVTYRGEDFFHGIDREASHIIDRTEREQPGTAFPFSVLTKTMRRVMLDYGRKILIKSPNHGCMELREELCAFLARSRGLSVRPEQVVIGSGAEYLYGLIVQLLGTDEVYGLEQPSYNKIREVYEAFGAKCDLLPMGRDGILTKELEKTKARILHVTPFNSFPSGITADISKKHEYLRWAAQRDGVLIEDNYDSELTVSRKMEEPLYSMDKGARVIYLNTFSRTIAPSMRIGYMVLPETKVEDFNRKLGFYSCTVPIFDQYVIAELLAGGDFERHINRVRRKRRKKEGEA